MARAVTGQVSPRATDVDRARERLGEVFSAPTPLRYSARLSVLTGANVFVKHENEGPVRSYKWRGAYNTIAQLPPTTEVTCPSAGNHAQGVAFALRERRMRGTIFVPEITPAQKRERIRTILGDYDGVELVVAGATLADTIRACHDHVAASGAHLVPPFDHPDVIAGQGTVLAEVVDQLGGPPDLVVVPVGGGGLLAGTLVVAETHRGVKVVGVEPVGAASMSAALAAGRPVDIDDVDQFVDGAAVKRVGELPFTIANAARPRMVTVENGAISDEIVTWHNVENVIVEPAGALTSAALCGPVRPRPGSTVVCVMSGGNNDAGRFGDILARADAHRRAGGPGRQLLPA